MRPIVTMRSALADPDLFARVFAGESWSAWRTILIAICGEALTPEERTVFESLTGRPQEPREPVEEAWPSRGGAAGGTRAVAVLAAYYGAFVTIPQSWRPANAPLADHERLRRSSDKALQYLDGIFIAVPALDRSSPERQRRASPSRRGSISSVRPRLSTIRGGTAAAIIADEASFWRNEATANPDSEFSQQPVRCSRQPAARDCRQFALRAAGEVWNAFERDYGAERRSADLHREGASRALNPSLPQVIARAYERDPPSLCRVWRQFRTTSNPSFSRGDRRRDCSGPARAARCSWRNVCGLRRSKRRRRRQ